jgi:hypothetical protein
LRGGYVVKELVEVVWVGMDWMGKVEGDEGISMSLGICT